MQPSHREDALAIVRRLRDSGHVAYFAGGCVRDMLLGLDPKDFDVATDAPPPRVRELFNNTQPVGAAFGVILVRHSKSVIEVATFRTDVSYEDGRRPTSVKFTNAEEDAKRRDFTINGLFFDPIENKVIDYVGGQEDLKNKILRAIGEPNHRFEEDHLRLLRAVRFAARFDLKIDPATHEAIKSHSEHLVRISPERIAEELRIMLAPPTRVRAWRMLQTYGLDDVIFRFAKFRDSPPHDEIRAHRTFFDRVVPDRTIPFGMSLAAVSLEFAFQHVAHWPSINIRPMVRASREALRISNEESDAMEGTLYGIEMLNQKSLPSVALLKRFLARPTAFASRAIFNAMPEHFVDPQYRSGLERRLSELESTDFSPAPFVTGDDLTAAGLSPGPVFKRVLDAVYDAQLEDRVKTQDDAIKLAMELAREGK